MSFIYLSFRTFVMNPSLRLFEKINVKMQIFNTLFAKSCNSNGINEKLRIEGNVQPVRFY